MSNATIIKWVCAALLFIGAFSARANSIGMVLDIDGSGRLGGELTVFVQYDFTDFAMFGGGLNLIYDPSILELVSFSQDLPNDAQAAASPVGQLEYPGFYAGFGIGTFEFFNGMTSAGIIAEFSFNIIGDSTTAIFEGCGGGGPHDYHTFEGLICITPNSINPFVSLAGDDVTLDILTGPGVYIPPENPVPLPAALWLFMGAVGLVAGLQKKQ